MGSIFSHLLSYRTPIAALTCNSALQPACPAYRRQAQAGAEESGLAPPQRGFCPGGKP